MTTTESTRPTRRDGGLSRLLVVFDTWIPTILMVGVFVMLSYGVLARQVLHTPLTFAYEATQLMSVWLVMLGAGLAARNRSMIAFMVTPSSFEERFGPRLARPRASAAVATALFLAYQSALMARDTHQLYEALGVRRAVGAWALPAGFLLLATHYAIMAARGPTHEPVTWQD